MAGVSGIGGPSPLRLPEEVPGLETRRRGLSASVGAPNETSGATVPGTAGFSATVKEFLGNVNETALRSESIFDAFVRGEVKDLHTVALAQQEAAIAVRLVTEMRDKLLQSYQEIMRMQM